MKDESLSIEKLLSLWKEFTKFKINSRSSDEDFRRFTFYEFMEWLKKKNE